jgi:hypothetical protein
MFSEYSRPESWNGKGALMLPINWWCRWRAEFFLRSSQCQHDGRAPMCLSCMLLGFATGEVLAYHDYYAALNAELTASAGEPVPPARQPENRAIQSRNEPAE